MSSPPESLPTIVTKRHTAGDDPIRAKLLHRLGIYDAAAASNIQSQPMTAAQHRRLRILRGMGVGHAMMMPSYSMSPPDGSAVRLPLGGAQPFQEKLKTDDDDDYDDGDDNIVMMSHNNNDNEDDVAVVSDDACNSAEKQFRVGSSDTEASSFSSSSSPKDSATTNTTTTPKHHRVGSRKIAFQDQVQVVPIPTRYEYSDRIKSRIWSNRHELQENAERNALEFAAEGWDWRTVTEDDGMFICSVSGELVHPIHLQHLMQQQQQDQDQQEQQQQQDHGEEEQKTGLERGTPVH